MSEMSAAASEKLQHISENLESHTHVQGYELTQQRSERTLLSHTELDLRLCEAGSKG